MKYTRFTNLEANEIKATKIIASKSELPSELPEYSATDSGKVLSVGPDGKLKWVALE